MKLLPPQVLPQKQGKRFSVLGISTSSEGPRVPIEFCLLEDGSRSTHLLRNAQSCSTLYSRIDSESQETVINVWRYFSLSQVDRRY